MYDNYYVGNNYQCVNRVNLVFVESIITNRIYKLKINLHGIEVSYVYPGSLA